MNKNKIINYRLAKLEDNQGIFQVHKNAILITNKVYYSNDSLIVWLGNKNPQSYNISIQNKVIFIAESEGKIIGFSELSAINNEVRAVYVDPEYMRLGVGKNLLNKVIDLAKESRIKKLTLESTIVAKDFYLKNGFRLIKPIEHKFNSEHGIKCFLMEKIL